MIRNVVAIIVGLFIGGSFNMGMIQLSHVVYPPPEGLDVSDFEDLKTYIVEHGMPLGSWVMVLIAHAGGSLVSGFVCGLIAMRQWYVAAIGMGLFWMLGGITMLFILPCPVLFAIADIILYVPAACLGVMLGGAITGRFAYAQETVKPKPKG